MSYDFPNIDSRHIIKDALNSKGLSTLGKIQNQYEALHEAPLTEGQLKKIKESLQFRKDNFTRADEALLKMGTLVKYDKNTGMKEIEKYKSQWFQQKLKQLRSPLDEKDLISGVKKIGGDCDLIGTTLDSLKKVETIGGSLHLDTSSALKDLSSLKKIGKSVFVHAKNKTEMMQFLDKIHLPKEAIKGKLQFIMKNYL